MVEAIVNGVQVSHNPNDWAGVGVPYLLLSLRVLLRNYHEAVLTQHISSQLAVFLAQEPRGPQREQRLVAFFKVRAKWPPRCFPHRVSTDSGGAAASCAPRHVGSHRGLAA